MTDTMKAGRELDALVAEKVLGWVWLPDRAAGRAATLFSPGRLEAMMDQYVADNRIASPVNAEIPSSLPRYSSDIAAAWKVVETMHGDGVSTSPVWRAWLREWSRFDWMAMSATQVAERVCLSAITAVGVEV